MYSDMATALGGSHGNRLGPRALLAGDLLGDMLENYTYKEMRERT